MSQHEISLDNPLAFPVYSAAGKLLLGKGQVIQTSSQLARLFDVGAFREDVSRESRSTQEGQQPVLISTSNREPVRKPAASGGAFPAIWSQPENFLLTPVNGQAPLSVHYVGMVKDESLLVRLPEGHEPLQQGTELDAKLLIGRNLYTFRTTVASSTQTPFEITFLHYPEAVTKHVVRQHFRVAVDMPARLLRNDALTAGFSATVNNLSLNGVGVELEDCTLEQGEHFKLSLRFGLGGRAHAILLNCVARNVRTSNGKIMVGAQFSGIADDARRLVKDFVFEAATGSSL
ncbi:PilZ domain-containing protein [Paraburkholderia sp. PREW-6R]|uniref:flagellar brake protein n=1 Tax=Paraburkholderia sp. PREW-6R TaxID=3141544 RepID=UPI0031F48C98